MSKSSPLPTAAQLAGQRVWVMAKGYAPDEGGMQSYASGVAEAYAAAGAEVTVFTQTSRGPRREQVGGVLLVDVGPGGGLGVVRRLLQAVRQERTTAGVPAFVHGTTWRTSVVPMLLGLPYFTTFHGREFMGGGSVVLAIMRRVARRAMGIVAVSAYSAARLQSRLGGNLLPIVAHNGVSIDGEAAPEKGEGGAPAFLFSLCRMEPRKNIAACVRACARLKASGHSFRYTIAGRGPELEHLRALIAELDLADEVTLAGFVPDAEAAALYRDADIFLHPQIGIADGRDFEGFGIAIADAMLCRTAVIVGAEGGSAELVDDGVSGLVVDGRDDDAVVNAVDRLLSDERFRNGMAVAAEVRARSNFTWAQHIATILDGLNDQKLRDAKS